MYDTRAVRMALRALGSEPAPVPVDGPERVVLAGGGNDVAMSLYRAMGRGAKELSEAQLRQRQEQMLEQFEREAQQVLRMIGAFRTVVSLEDERAARRGLPQPEEVTVVATGTGTLHHAAVGAVPVQPGATYKLRDLTRRNQDGTVADDQSTPGPLAAPVVWHRPPAPSEADVGAEEGAVGRWEGTSGSRVRVAPDMETCDDCRQTVVFDPADGSFTHEDDSPAWSKDGHIIHGDTLQRIVDAERVNEMARPTATIVQQGPAPAWWDPDQETEEEAKRIVRRAMEAARADLEASKPRAAHHGRDSGIEPGHLDTVEFEGPRPQPNPEESVLARVRHGLARARKWLDGYTARELEELDEARQQGISSD